MQLKNSNPTRSSAITIYKYSSFPILQRKQSNPKLTYKKMSYWSSNSNDFQFFASTVDPMPDRFNSHAQHRPKHHVTFSDEYEERVVESPRTTRRAPVIDPPTRRAPVIEPPTRRAPVIEPPTRRAPVIEPPTRRAPVIEPPRTTRKTHVTHYVARDQAEDVDEEAAEFIKFEHNKFLMNQQSMRND
ncbi:hypothetical protein ACFX15_020740 [Malus domestica]